MGAIQHLTKLWKTSLWVGDEANLKRFSLMGDTCIVLTGLGDVLYDMGRQKYS